MNACSYRLMVSRAMDAVRYPALYTTLAPPLSGDMRRSLAIVIGLFFVVAGVASVAPAETYLYADPSTFSTLNSGTATSFLLGNATVNATRLSVFSATNGLTLGSEVINFPATNPSNPDWVAGARDMFRLAFSSGSGTNRDGSVSVEYTFPSFFPTSGYLIFADFDVKETLKVQAYDASNSLISHASFSFAYENGRQPGGSAFTLPTWSSEGGYSGVLAYGNNTSISGTDPVVTLRASVPIARLVYESDNDPYDTVINNDLYFNFTIPASPIPEINPAGMGPVLALVTGSLGLLERRRKRAT